MQKMNAKELRLATQDPEVYKTIKKNPVYIILDNVLDTYNIGAVFRLADAIAAEKVILCAGSEIPPNHRIKKASINTTEWVAWEYAETAVSAIQNLKLKVKNLQVVAVELDPRSKPYTEVTYSFPIAVVVGHETDGVSEEVMAMADHIIELPMWGINISLNVMVSLGIALYEIMQHVPQKNSITLP